MIVACNTNVVPQLFGCNLTRKYLPFMLPKMIPPHPLYSTQNYKVAITLCSIFYESQFLRKYVSVFLYAQIIQNSAF